MRNDQLTGSAGQVHTAQREREIPQLDNRLIANIERLGRIVEQLSERLGPYMSAPPPDSPNKEQQPSGITPYGNNMLIRVTALMRLVEILERIDERLEL